MLRNCELLITSRCYLIYESIDGPADWNVETLAELEFIETAVTYRGVVLSIQFRISYKTLVKFSPAKWSLRNVCDCNRIVTAIRQVRDWFPLAESRPEDRPMENSATSFAADKRISMREYAWPIDDVAAEFRQTPRRAIWRCGSSPMTRRLKAVGRAYLERHIRTGL